MPRFARKSRASSCPAGHAPGRAAGIAYDSHADGLYRQALLTLGDADLAEQVVLSVIVDECLRPGTVRTAGRRLAVSTYWRCQELARSRGHRTGPVLRPPAAAASATDQVTLSVQERGALGLVLFGGLGYLQASRELAMPPGDLASLLHVALRRLAGPPGAALTPAGT